VQSARFSQGFTAGRTAAEAISILVLTAASDTHTETHTEAHAALLEGAGNRCLPGQRDALGFWNTGQGRFLETRRHQSSRFLASRLLLCFARPTALRTAKTHSRVRCRGQPPRAARQPRTAARRDDATTLCRLLAQGFSRVNSCF